MLTKPRNAPKASNTSMYTPNRRRGLSPLMIIGISVPVLLILIGAGIVVAMPKLFSHAAATPAVPNPNCTLIVPAQALTAKGLGTPYQLFAPNAAANGPCNEANVAAQSAFVQATIYDPATGKFSIYSPLIIDKGTTPAVVPTAPVLPANAVVGLWFGFNGTNLTLQGTNGNTLKNARCVNGLPQSVFGQFSYCNAVNFFKSVNAGIANGLVTVPPLGTAKDGLTCPTSRDFSVVDQDQSDNVQTQYLVNGNGQTAQNTAANLALMPNDTVIGNPSDNALITKFIDPTLGCTPWTAPDLANNGTPNLSLALDEIQAQAFQKAPIALVPLTDPMTLNNAAASTKKTNLYRAGSDQTPINATDTGSGTTYCQNLVGPAGLTRIKNDMPLTLLGTSPAPAMANSLFTFLAMRLNQSYTNLGCQGLLNAPNPVALTMTGNIVTAATITLPGTTTTTTGTGTTTTTTGTGTTTTTTGTGTGTTTTQTATGTAAIVLNPNAGNATLTMNVTYPKSTNMPITTSIVTTAGTTVFTKTINTDNNGQATLNMAINGLQGLTTLPATWLYQVTDPNLNNTVVGSGAVIVTGGVNGAATLGAPAATTPAAGTTTTPATAATTTPVAGATPAATGTPAASTTSPAPPASAGQVTTTNAPYNGVKKSKHHMW